MPVTEAAAERLQALRRFDPLLTDWVDQRRLHDGEADLVILAAEATERRQPLRITLPGGSSRLAAALGVHTAVRQLTQPGRYPHGPIALLAGTRERIAATSLTADGRPVAESLGVVRLRADSKVQLLNRARVEPLGATHRLVLVSPRSRWPNLDTRIGVAVLDELALGSAYDDAHQWALQRADVVHVVAALDPGQPPVSHEVTWPLVAATPDRWGRASSWPSQAKVRIEHAGPGPEGLSEARQRIATAPMDRPWPPQLSVAAALSRALAITAVPLTLYDLHTLGSIATPFAARLDALKETRTASLPGDWAAFAATDWAPIKHRLLAAAEALDEHNPKAEAIGLVVEALLHDGHNVDVWVDSQVLSRALQDHLLTAGFAISPDHFDDGRLAIRSYGDARDPLTEPRACVLTGLPAARQLPAVLSGALGGPLIVLTYDFEAARCPGYFGWMLNNANLDRHLERQTSIHRSLGPGLDEVPAPRPIGVLFAHSDEPRSDAAALMELPSDTAEFAALTDDEWLSLALQHREHHGPEPTAMRPAEALLVEPGPGVLLLAAHAVVDRLVARRLRPTPVSSLGPGMQILTSTHATGGVFAAVRPLLDHARGLGTKFWLSQWDDALLAALQATGGPVALTDVLVQRGAQISSTAVASWASPYRIGPRDPQNVLRAAAIGSHRVAVHHYQRIHAVMRGVRVEHGQLGRQLAAAVRAHLKGDACAFDQLEERYGTDIETLFGDPVVHVIQERLARGHAPAAALGRVHAVAEAQQIFEPEENP